MKKKKINGILIGVVIVSFVVAIALIVTGKIKLSDIMGNTAQGEYVCAEGFKLKNGNWCEKDVTVEPKPGYTCPNNYILEGDICRYYRPAEKSYKCSVGGTLNGTQCEKSATSVTYTCPSGYEKYGTSQCRKVSYTCPSGYTLNGTQCRKVSRYIYTCPSGYSKYGTQCRKVSGYTYTCPSGYSRYGTSQCRKVTYTYTCPSGYSRYGTSQCRKATYTYTCPSGYSRYGTSQCRKATYTYTCPSGYYKYGTTRCKKGKTTINATRRTSYSTINATRRTSYSTINATRTTSYSTINATSIAQYSTINANTSAIYSTINATRTTLSTINAIKKYTCPTGWSLYNTNKCRRNASIQYTCKEGDLSQTRCIVTKKATYENTSCPSVYKYNSTTKKCHGKVSSKAIKRGSKNVGSFSFENSNYIFEKNKKFSSKVRFNVRTETGHSVEDVTGSCTVSNSNVIAIDSYNQVFLPRGAASNSAQVSFKTVAPGTSTLTCTLTTGHKATTTITIK